MHRRVIYHQKSQLKVDMSSRYEQQWSVSVTTVTGYMPASPRTALNHCNSGEAHVAPDQLMVSMLLQYGCLVFGHNMELAPLKNISVNNLLDSAFSQASISAVSSSSCSSVSPDSSLSSIHFPGISPAES